MDLPVQAWNELLRVFFIIVFIPVGSMLLLLAIAGVVMLFETHHPHQKGLHP